MGTARPSKAPLSVCSSCTAPVRRNSSTTAPGRLLTGTVLPPSAAVTSKATSAERSCCSSMAWAWLIGKPINTQPMSKGARMGTITNW